MASALRTVVVGGSRSRHRVGWRFAVPGRVQRGICGSRRRRSRLRHDHCCARPGRRPRHGSRGTFRSERRLRFPNPHRTESPAIAPVHVAPAPRALRPLRGRLRIEAGPRRTATAGPTALRAVSGKAPSTPGRRGTRCNCPHRGDCIRRPGPGLTGSEQQVRSTAASRQLPVIGKCFCAASEYEILSVDA